ncbi:hypothetical protein AVEN_275197-1 [Araneus ventricosus]|uniref:Uncharacterized protein n=1 Tax=Araneus ventricosus TaxID=182803 RepID=A0A4Y2NR08_ARAVE|nr:hypothetical protein AVEN_275197-1 [Araneus ventricosus]
MQGQGRITSSLIRRSAVQVRHGEATCYPTVDRGCILRLFHRYDRLSNRFHQKCHRTQKKVRRVIVTPAVYPPLDEFLHFDIQSTGQKSHCAITGHRNALF